MVESVFEMCGVKVPPGKRVRLEFPVAQLFDQTEITIPIEIIRGRNPGPTLLLSAAMHGDEINGCEVLKRILALRGLKEKLSGTLVVVPIVNVFGFNRNMRYLPDRRDLNRCFPGVKSGSLGAQVAYKFLNDIALKCTHVIDFHTGTVHRSNLPQVRACLDSPGVKDLATAFNVPVILDSSLRSGSLRASLFENKVPCIVYEGGEALRYEEPVIKAAVHGTLHVMESLGMVDAKAYKLSDKKRSPYIAHSSFWQRAPSSGSVRFKTKLGAHVKKGDVLGVISDPFGRNKVNIIASHQGVVIGATNLPLVMNGDAVMHIATFENSLKVEKEIQLSDEELDFYNIEE